MYELRPYITAWCAAAAVLLIEHLIFAPRPTPYWPRYMMGLAAIGAGLWALERLTLQPSGFWGFVAISSSGLIVLFGYGLRVLIDRTLSAVRKAGIIEGRVIEANRRATGIARDRDDR